MPRNPLAGFVLGVFGVAWGAIGLVLAAWAATAWLEPAKGHGLARWALDQWPLDLPWDRVQVADWVTGNIVPFAIAAAVALLVAGSNLRTARIAFRPANESHDGKGRVQLTARDEPRVGRPLEGAILLREAPAPGDEFEVVLAGGAYRAEQRVRARQGAHGVSLPFRFDVPAGAAPSAAGSPWRLEFAPAGRRAFASRVGLTMAPAPAREVMAARDSTPPSSPAHGIAEHMASLADALGVKLSQAQRDRLREKLSGPDAAAARQLEMLRQLTPQHMKVIKYGVIGFIVLFFLLPFVLSVLGLVLGAIFG